MLHEIGDHVVQRIVEFIVKVMTYAFKLAWYALALLLTYFMINSLFKGETGFALYLIVTLGLAALRAEIVSRAIKFGFSQARFYFRFFFRPHTLYDTGKDEDAVKPLSPEDIARNG